MDTKCFQTTIQRLLRSSESSSPAACDLRQWGRWQPCGRVVNLEAVDTAARTPSCSCDPHWLPWRRLWREAAPRPPGTTYPWTRTPTGTCGAWSAPWSCPPSSPAPVKRYGLTLLGLCVCVHIWSEREWECVCVHISYYIWKWNRVCVCVCTSLNLKLKERERDSGRECVCEVTAHHVCINLSKMFTRKALVSFIC